MRHPDRLDGERADGELILRSDLNQAGFIQQVMLFELAFHVGKRELRGVHRNLQLAQDPRQSPDVIFVAVGQDDGLYKLPVLHQEGNVGHHDIHAQQLALGEHQARVDHDNVVFPLQGEAVHPELAQSAQRYDFQLLSLHSLPSSMLSLGAPAFLRSARAACHTIVPDFERASNETILGRADCSLAERSFRLGTEKALRQRGR